MRGAGIMVGVFAVVMHPAGMYGAYLLYQLKKMKVAIICLAASCVFPFSPTFCICVPCMVYAVVQLNDKHVMDTFTD